MPTKSLTTPPPFLQRTSKAITIDHSKWCTKIPPIRRIIFRENFIFRALGSASFSHSFQPLVFHGSIYQQTADRPSGLRIFTLSTIEKHEILTLLIPLIFLYNYIELWCNESGLLAVASRTSNRFRDPEDRIQTWAHHNSLSVHNEERQKGVRAIVIYEKKYTEPTSRSPTALSQFFFIIQSLSLSLSLSLALDLFYSSHAVSQCAFKRIVCICNYYIQKWICCCCCYYYYYY